MKKTFGQILSLFIASAALTTFYSCKKNEQSQITSDQSSARSASLEDLKTYKASNHPLMMGYFRTWRDLATDPNYNKASIKNLPDSLDVALVFPDGTPPDNAFWKTLKGDYVPYLHERGTKVVMTAGVARFLDTKYTNDQAGYDQLAKEISDEYTKYGLDGLDIDVERYFNDDEKKRVIGVFNALSKYFGPKSNTGRLFIYDTNQDGNTEVFGAVHSLVDYVLVQSYGRSVSSLEPTYDTYAPYISPKQYLIGFSFYEENGADWGDVTKPISQSTAYQYAKWQPTQGAKGGVFSYAIDRDGSFYGENKIVATHYDITRLLIATMNPPAVQ